MVELTADTATHLLKCRHVLGHGVTNYRMRCHVLKAMDDGRLKVRVYGNRYWKGKDDVVQVRYVDSDRVIPIVQK